ATHRPGADAVDSVVRRAQTRIAFNACVQGIEEPIHVFYRRYQYAYETMIDAGNAKIDEEDISAYFLHASKRELCPREDSDPQQEDRRTKDASRDSQDVPLLQSICSTDYEY
ncbi:MAG: hypothetical protein ACK56I_12280, partial [bacterium]